jgi:predicted nucleic acid-binding protein
MSDTVVDSSVVAKWVLPESDSTRALQIVVDAASSGDRSIVLDLAFAEVANAI